LSEYNELLNIVKCSKSPLSEFVTLCFGDSLLKKSFCSMETTFNLLVRMPGISGGKPIVKGTRVSVAIILEWLATGGSPDKINEAHPEISVQAVQQALLYAGKELSTTEYIELPLAVSC
jgi:uncharacterized protein (DUF433 family)